GPGGLARWDRGFAASSVSAPSGFPGAQADCAGEGRAEEHERERHHGEERRELARKLMEDQPASRSGADETEAAREERPQEPSGALGGEVEREPQTEEAVGWAHDAQVRGARREHLGLVAEEPQ